MSIRTAVLALAACAMPLAAVAQEVQPRPFPQFEAKRIKPPAPGTGKRITIQIEPEPEAELPAPAAIAADSGAKPAGRYGWFWDKVAFGLEGSGPGRLDDALQALSGAKGLAAPRLQLMQDIVQERGVQILTESVGTEVSPALVLAVIAVESAGKADAVSSAGAQGLMQLMPDTAKRFGVSDALEAQQNIAGGIQYLNWLMGEFGGDPILVLAGYNAGEGAVRSHQGVPPYAETRDYVPKVLAAYQVARGLCMTPPQFLSDGCVFRLGK
ncbi:lytic transglycosylase domain-containing protein [Leisingera methylohalidivorans]|uniref:Lytic murein transglycosylase n=1 Tax=Leisingera methylohalidivorans DSM 14336 TaxID=999552 RepID=V9VXK9_9RHOB|nr:lytic transglycosylase domain-containing protein [Leisingera methylohalidivorans]AHD01612.1 lytic murein transglycosylase [Leisingera methylohalidivorans DSM 14336]